MKQESSLVVPYMNNQILLQLRDNDAPTRANMWSFFGGSVEKDESPLQAAIRESSEELSLVDAQPVFLQTIIRQKPALLYHKHIYLLPTTMSACEFRSRQKEGTSAEFYSIDAIACLHMKESDKNIAEDILRYLLMTSSPDRYRSTTEARQ